MNKQALSAYGAALREKLDGDMLRGLVDPRTIQPRKVEGDKFAPIKAVEVTEKVVEKREVTRVDHVRVEHTKWYDTAKYEPGQPGVFEVDRVHQFDNPDIIGPRRFSYFNGKQFGPISTNPDSAYAERFNVSSLSSSIRAFRGLKEA